MLFCLLIGSFYHSALASSVKTQSVPLKEASVTLLEYLTQEKTNLTNTINIEKQDISLASKKEFNEKMQHTLALLTMTSAKTESLDGLLDHQNKQQTYLNQRLMHLQQLPLTNAEPSIQEQVSKVEDSLLANNKAIDLINDNLILTNQLQTILNDEIKKLEVWNENFELEQKLIQIKLDRDKLNQELSLLYQNNIVTQPANDPQNQLNHEAKLLINNQYIALLHNKLNSLNIQKNVVKADILVLHNLDTKTLPLVIETYKDGIVQYNSIEKSIRGLSISLDNKSTFLINIHLKSSLDVLQKSLKEQIKKIESQKQTLLKNLENYQNQLKKLISSRQSLAEYKRNSWPVIINKLTAIPSLFYKYVKTLTLKVYDSYSWLDTFPTILLGIILSLIICSFIIFNYFLRSLTSDKERSRLTGYLYDGVLTIIQRNIPYLCLFTMLWAIFYFTSIAYSNYQLLFHIILVWLIFRVLILIARLVLLERISDSSGKDVKLYYRLKWLLLSGGWTTAFMVFSHLYPLSLLLQDIFNRLFMLFLLAVSLVAWKSKDVIPYLLRPLLKAKKRYFKNIISLLVVLVPITLFTTATIGILGFVNLAWTMSRYQAYALLVLVGYILARGLVFDALELFSEWMISSLKNGWLWIEVFLKPLDKILRVILLLCSILILFQVFGWHSDSMVMINLVKVAQYSIVNFTGVHITVASIIEFFVLLALFIWASKWTREFCYRWLYKNAKDVGIRNSLSVFTQYAVILVGTFITLHVLGLDFSGMSMILGGLAVGMGFGLRDFASNIVGGIMLLIERPVREGDLITLGEYEGRVAHIGIRSMRVSSWDNMEVLIPNAETFNKPFTNWTHQDSIVRTVVPIKVSRADDPVMIQQLILDVLAIIPEIVPDPPAQVFLKKIDAALIEFEARYFINVQTYTRFEVRSKVLFAITAQFKAAGVRAPIEPISIEFKEGHGEFFNKNSASED
jgi:potassium efflux system protein